MHFDQSGVGEAGSTPFWRAAYGADVEAMRLLVSYGADPNITTMRTPGRVRTGDATREITDVAPTPPVPVGGPAVAALLAASGVGYGEGLAANHHRFAPGGMLVAVKYLVEELHVDVNVRDHEGNTALHNAAARGDNEMITYLVAHGADPKAVNREGKTTVDMANGPVQRISPFPDTIKLLEGMGAKNNHARVLLIGRRPTHVSARRTLRTAQGGHAGAATVRDRARQGRTFGSALFYVTVPRKLSQMSGSVRMNSRTRAVLVGQPDDQNSKPSDIRPSNAATIP